MIVTFNLVLLVLCIGLSMILFEKFIYEPIQDNKKFKLYALRDKLCRLAMSGLIKEDSSKYQFIMENLNYAVNRITKKISIISYFNAIIEVQLDNVKETEKMMVEIQDDKYLKDIQNEYMRILYNEIKKDFRKITILIVMLIPIFWITDSIFKMNSKDKFSDLKKGYKDYEDKIVKYS